VSDDTFLVSLNGRDMETNMETKLEWSTRPSFSTDMFHGLWKAMIAKTLVELDIPSLIVDGHKTVAELAEVTKTRPELLYRFLHAAAACQFISEGSIAEDKLERVFTSSGITQSLCPDQPLYFLVSYFLAGSRVEAWNGLTSNIRTGQCSMDTVLGVPFWEYLDTHPQENHIMDGCMTALADIINPSLVNAYPDFAQTETVMDVGGGGGNFLRLILQKYPTVKGILFDRELEAHTARERMKSAGLSDRCTCIAGSFLDEIPVGASIFVLKAVLHDWNDEQALLILQNVRKSARDDAKVLIIDVIMPDTDPPLLTCCIDMQMVCVTDGKVRTAQEYRSLLEKAGFALERMIPIEQTGYCITEGRVSV
jgi:hypothetical protein